MRSLFFLILIFFFSAKTFAQDNFNEAFTYFPRNIYVYVPSNICIDNDLQSNFIFKSFEGELSLIRTYYADFNMNLRGQEKSSPENKKHIAGGGFFNDREGDFFTKIRAFGRYAVHIPLNENLTISAGTTINLLNYSFHASSQGATGSDFGWTGSVSSSLYSPTFRLGIAINDFNSPQLKPINYSFQLPRFLTFYGEKLFEVNMNTQIRSSARCNWIMNGQALYVLQSGFIFSEIVGINGFWNAGRGWGLAFDINKIKIYKSKIDFTLAYQIPLKGTYPPVSQYELNLLIYLQKE